MWLLSRVCEEFHCTPSVARKELYERNPWPDVLDMLEMRAYARTKEYLDSAKTPEESEKVEATPLGKLVREIEFEIAKARKERSKQR